MLAALCALPLAAGCGSGGHAKASAPADAKPASQVTVRGANCMLWRVLSPADRRRLVVGLRNFFGGAVDSPGARGQVMPDQRAYTFLTSYCRQPYARAFMLYRLYGNAAAFTAPKKK